MNKTIIETILKEIRLHEQSGRKQRSQVTFAVVWEPFTNCGSQFTIGPSVIEGDFI